MCWIEHYYLGFGMSMGEEWVDLKEEVLAKPCNKALTGDKNKPSGMALGKGNLLRSEPRTLISLASLLPSSLLLVSPTS